MLFYRKRYIKQFTYITLTEPTFVTPDLLALAKEHLRYAATDDNEDDYLTLLLNVAYKFAQTYTNRTILTTEYKTFRDSFRDCCFVLRRSPLQTVESIKYLQSNVLVTVPTTDYYVTEESTYARILRPQGVHWNYMHDKRQQCIQITFIAGYGNDYTSIPQDLLMALFQHVAKLYESRGDCDDNATCAAALPNASRIIYDIYQIRDLTGETDCGNEYSNGYNNLWF